MYRCEKQNCESHKKENYINEIDFVKNKKCRMCLIGNLVPVKNE